ncbi:hypothetical protein C1M55_01695 [Rhodococcus qingshengii]|nr:hypothetical protein C1M55_01695 [Rhodococcus qingshengii]
MSPMSKFSWMEALRGADLSHAEYRVLINLSTYARGDLTNARPSLQTLCKAAQVTDKTAKKSIRTLIEKGWIVRTQSGGRGTGRTNVYALGIPDVLQGTEYPPETDSLEGSHRPPEMTSREVIDADLGVYPVPSRGVIDAESGGYSLPPNQKEPSGTNNREGHPLSYVSNTGVGVGEAKSEPEDARIEEAPALEERPAASFGFGSIFGETDVTAVEHEPPPRPVALQSATPASAPKEDPLEWIKNGVAPITDAEIATAETMLAEGASKYNIVQTIRLNRKSLRMPRRRAPAPADLPVAVPIELDRAEDAHHANAAQT